VQSLALVSLPQVTAARGGRHMVGCDKFVDELKKLRPRAGDRLAGTLALHHHDAKAHPRGVARQYDKAHRGEPPAPAKKKRAK
jgi:hypothetical protein